MRQVRDAVHQPFDKNTLAEKLESKGIQYSFLNSSVASRSEYLTRPDKGRALDQNSREQLDGEKQVWDMGMVVCDGLSTRAIHENCAEFIILFRSLALVAEYSIAPVQIVQNGRVAIGDEICESLKTKLAIVLIGERPGLSSPDSLGIYLTYAPRVGTTDEARNCISNVREKGLPIPLAVKKLAYLVETAFVEKRSGVMLKDKMDAGYLPFGILPELAGGTSKS